MNIVSFMDAMEGFSNYWFPDILVDVLSSQTTPEGDSYRITHPARVDNVENTGIFWQVPRTTLTDHERRKHVQR